MDRSNGNSIDDPGEGVDRLDEVEEAWGQAALDAEDEELYDEDALWDADSAYESDDDHVAMDAYLRAHRS